MPMKTVDPITLDLIENALKNARMEMDAVVYRTAMSPTIREQHDEFPMIADAEGRMIVGQFGSDIRNIIRQLKGEIYPGDVIVVSDPYRCAGSISHANDWLALLPVFYQNELVGYTSIFGHMMDVGGVVPGSQPAHARTVFEEGIRVPPVKFYERGRLNQGVLDIMLNNSRTPEMNHSDLMALVAGCRTAERRVIDLCERFGKETYMAACEELLARTHRAMKELIRRQVPEEKVVFEDWVDTDGRGNGPLKMMLTIWREGDVAHFDWTGTAPQAEGPINFFINEGLFKMFVGVYLIMAYDPAILFNDGFYNLFAVNLPDGTLMHPRFPAAISNRLNVHTRMFDVISGVLGQKQPHLGMAAGYGTSPQFIYSGWDKEGNYFQLVELLFGGIPGRPVGDGLDGHSWWPLFTATPAEYTESYYPVLIDSYEPSPDSGGPGLHRGGTGICKVYQVLEPGEISIIDDRHKTHPWGIFGGRFGGLSDKVLYRKDGGVEQLTAMIDFVKVQPGDRLLFQTAGAGGWGDPLERPAERVRFDVSIGIVSREQARLGYGVVLTEDLALDGAATQSLRAQMAAERGEVSMFDFGPLPPELQASG